jgi:hypothetical protein
LLKVVRNALDTPFQHRNERHSQIPSDREDVPMYALVDRPIALLGQEERFLLDAMRAWVQRGFEARGLAARQVAFDDAMRALDRGSTDTLTFQRPCHATVEEDEAIVLGLWRLVRADRIGAACAAAARLVTADAARDLTRAMARYGANDD